MKASAIRHSQFLRIKALYTLLDKISGRPYGCYCTCNVGYVHFNISIHTSFPNYLFEAAGKSNVVFFLHLHGSIYLLILVYSFYVQLAYGKLCNRHRAYMVMVQVQRNNWLRLSENTKPNTKIDKSGVQFGVSLCLMPH